MSELAAHLQNAESKFAGYLKEHGIDPEYTAKLVALRKSLD